MSQAAAVKAGQAMELPSPVASFHLITTAQEFDDSKFAADQLRYQKRQETKLRTKARSLSFELIPMEPAGCVP